MLCFHPNVYVCDVNVAYQSAYQTIFARCNVQIINTVTFSNSSGIGGSITAKIGSSMSCYSCSFNSATSSGSWHALMIGMPFLSRKLVFIKMLYSFVVCPLSGDGAALYAEYATIQLYDSMFM
jgi:hypothetical protein